MTTITAGIAQAIHEKYSNSGRVPDYFEAFISDVLAELTTTGRLVPEGGMPLTAEQVEDVRKAVYRYDYPEPEVREARFRLRDSLFRATEPVSEATAEYLERTRRFQSTTPPAPAVPAEEETKAERDASVVRREALGRVAQQLYEQSFDGCDGTFYHDFGRALEDFLPSQGWVRIPASSPVVPAPTETGPWQTYGDVPEGVKYRSSRPGSTLTFTNRGGVRFVSSTGLPDGYERLAPFTAIKGAEA